MITDAGSHERSRSFIERPVSNPPRPRLSVVVLFGPAALALAGCGGFDPTTDSIESDDPGVRHVVEVVARDDVFEPTALDVPVGSHVTVEVTNVGDRPHNLVIHRPPLSTGTLQPGEGAIVTVAAGNDPVTYNCSFHPGMTGQFRTTLVAAEPQQRPTQSSNL